MGWQTLNCLSNYRRYYSKILPGKYDPEVVPVMHLVQVLFSASKRDCTQAASEQPTGHSGLTSKAKEEGKEGFKVYI